MKLLLDTHSLIWFLDNNTRLSDKSRRLIEDLDNEVYVSVVSWFEIAIKSTIGKLILPDSLADAMMITTSKEIITIDIRPKHLIRYQELPIFKEHRDPFDRMIAATASCEGLILLTMDEKFKNYSAFVDLA